MQNSVQIRVTKKSQRNLEKNFRALGTTMKKAAPEAVFAILMKIKAEAQLYLTGRKHIITNRLRASIHVQMGDNSDNVADNQKTYTDDEGNSYNSELKTVSLNPKSNEGAVGSNVEYAATIESGSRPHVIKVKNAKVLGTPKTGYFGTKVNHPGYRGDSYLYRAMKHFDITKSVADDLKNSIKFGAGIK